MAVAASGGRDSTALLHATAHAAAAAGGLNVVALHVHHGLQVQADAWQSGLAATCRRWASRGLPITFDVTRLAGSPAAGESVEAWARRERYRALGSMARRHGAGLVLLAHHRRDQAETFLLQALRGAGTAGLSAMPRITERDGLVWARPWLDQPSHAVDAYVRRHRLRFVDDPSNRDAAYARSRLRQQVMTALVAAFPDAERALAAAAGHMQQAQACLDDVADGDLATLCDGDALVLARWRALSPARARNALQRWLRRQIGRGAPHSLLERLLRELDGDGPARWPAPDAVVVRYRGRLRCQPATVPARDATADAARDADAAYACSLPLSWAAPGSYPLPPWRGRFELQAVDRGGVPADWLADCEARPRHGGERFQRDVGTPPRSLKKQFQSAGVPEWQRHGPLLYARGELLYVPGLGTDARVRASEGEPQWQVHWQPDR